MKVQSNVMCIEFEERFRYLVVVPNALN